MRAALKTLELPGFPRLALAYWVNEVGDWLGEVALAVLVFDATGSPLATAALFVAMKFAPALLAPPLVARIESFESRTALPLLYAGEAAAFAGLALLAGNFALVPILLLATLDGALASAARALTRAAASAVLTPADRLREGNALLNVGFTAAAAVGPALAGVLVAGASPAAALLADAVSFLAVALMLASTRSLPRAKVEAAGWFTRLREAFRYVRERHTLSVLLAAQALAFVFFAAVIPVEVVLAKEVLDAGDAGYAALLTSWGVGMVAGSAIFAAVRRSPLPFLLATSTLAIGCAYLAIGAAPTLLVACAASSVGGAGNGVQVVALVTAVQEMTVLALHARVIALLESISRAMPGVGFLLGGGAAALLGARSAFLLAGAGVLAVLGAAVAVLRGHAWIEAVANAPPDE